MIIKPGSLMHGNTKYGQMCRSSLCSQHQAWFMFGERPRKPLMSAYNCEIWRRMYDDLSSNILALCWSQNCSEWSNYFQELRGASYDPIFFADNDTVFQDNSSAIHTASSIQSWFEKHEDVLRHLRWPAQSPDLTHSLP